MRSLALIAILWLQLLVGLVGLFLSSGGVHTGAMSMESSSGLRAKCEKARLSPDFHALPEIGGVSYEEVLDWYYSACRARANNAGYALLLSASQSCFAVVMLRLAYRNRRISRSDTGMPISNRSEQGDN
jgi:hypothetical protein